VLSRDGLRECVRLERDINLRLAALDLAEQDLQRRQALVDAYSQRSVDDFNQRVDRFNRDGEAANALVRRFNAQCANHAYFEADMQAVRRELGPEG
jgi:multidrug resistance efflux pump